MANTYLTKTFSGAGNMDKWTFSAWVKKSDVGAYGTLFHAKTTGNTNFESLCITTGGNFDWEHYEYTSSSYKARLKTNRLFRDPSAFFHIMCVWDSANATAGDRMRLYVNGVEETSFATDTNPTQNQDSIINGANAHNIGGSGTSLYLSGILSHVHFSDGYALAPTVFGETDATTGEWKIKTSPSFTLGTNGFTILKDGNTITDQSSNSNDFTLGGGTLTPTEDNPSNVFATFNPLIGNHGATFANGNTFVYRNSAGADRRIACTLGATSGKYYAEFQLGTEQWGGVCLTNGGDIARTEAGSNGYMGEYADDKSVGVRQDGLVYSHGANVTSAQWDQGSLGATDKLCLALDLDNKKLFLGKNGVWNVSSNPATNTGGITLTGDSYTFCGATDNADCKINTGNGYFGTDAISSEGTNASGIGKFEYDVPTGFTALSTKGLNE